MRNVAFQGMIDNQKIILIVNISGIIEYQWYLRTSFGHFKGWLHLSIRLILYNRNYRMTCLNFSYPKNKKSNSHYRKLSYCKMHSFML